MRYVAKDTDHLKRMIRRKGFSYKHFATEADIDINTLYKVIAGRQVNEFTAVLIACALNVSITYIFKKSKSKTDMKHLISKRKIHKGVDVSKYLNNLKKTADDSGISQPTLLKIIKHQAVREDTAYRFAKYFKFDMYELFEPVEK